MVGMIIGLSFDFIGVYMLLGVVIMVINVMLDGKGGFMFID